MKYIWTICLLLICSCNTVKEDTIINEEYEKLFPPKEIEKPENKRGDLVVQLCDPELALENYKYPGTELPGDREEYGITLECLFQEIAKDGSTLVETATARYEVKYINAEKELVTITCAKNAGEENPEEDEEEESEENEEDTGKRDDKEATHKKMVNGEKLTIKFKAYSGFPLYLSVTGVGPRNSSVKASIKAVSTDGLIEIPELKSEQYQNEEGPNMLKHPYCEYIILP